jgi:hypothetical protein
MQDWITQHQALVVVVALACFVVLWIGTMNLVAWASGWKRLAERFRGQAEFSGSVWSWQSAQMRFGVNYNNCLKVGADQAGLFIRPTVLFRSGHLPLYIPWIEITVQPRQVFLMTVAELRLGRTEQIPFRIRPKLAQRLAAAAGPSWPGPSALERI